VKDDPISSSVNGFCAVGFLLVVGEVVAMTTVLASASSGAGALHPRLGSM